MGVYAGYVRVSRVGGRDETLLSPKLQERAIRAWAGSTGHEIVMLPPELDASGGDDTRPTLVGAIEQIERGEIDGIAVWNFARFTRSLASSIRFLERIEGVGGQLHSASEQIDASTPEGRQTRNIMFAIAQGERERQALGFEKSKADAIARGVYIAGFTPVGYRKAADRRLEPDPDATPAVRTAFEMRAGGASWRAIAEHMAAELGRPMYGPTVSRMIRNPVYLGWARQGEHVNREAHEALVGRELWEAAQIAHPRPARGTHGPALLGGLIRCAGCSWRMTSTVKRGEREYRCRRRGGMGECPAPAIIAARLVDPLVERAFLAHAANLPVDAAELTRSIGEAEGSLAAAEAARDDFATATAGMARDHIAAGMAAHAEKVEAARRRLAEVRLAAPPLPEPGVLIDAWPDLDVAERNHVLRRALSVVWVRRGRGAEGRIRIIDASGAPPGLSRQGKPSAPRALKWVDADLPGEIRVPTP